VRRATSRGEEQKTTSNEGKQRTDEGKITGEQKKKKQEGERQASAAEFDHDGNDKE
jgi:hypothetical protein